VLIKASKNSTAGKNGSVPLYEVYKGAPFGIHNVVEFGTANTPGNNWSQAADAFALWPDELLLVMF